MARRLIIGANINNLYIFVVAEEVIFQEFLEMEAGVIRGNYQLFHEII